MQQSSPMFTRRQVVPAIAVLATLLLACGPDFPDELLLDGDDAVLRAATTDYRREFAAIAPAAAVPFKYVAGLQRSSPSGDGRIDIDCKELSEVLKGKSDSLSAPQKQSLEAYRAARRQLATPTTQPSAEIDPREMNLPGEFADYLEGLIANSRGDVSNAQAAWQHLLSRPIDDRRHRSLWAMYKLAKLQATTDRDGAVRGYQAVRDAAKSNTFTDRQGLAAASLGSEAFVELHRGNFARAIELYLEQQATGDPTATMSLMMTARDLFEAGDPALLVAAKDDRSREVVDVYILSHAGDWRLPYKAATSTQISAWLIAMQTQDIADERHAARFAWMAYQNGDFKTAADWVDRASANSAAAEWLRAKLLLRAGHRDDAAKSLSHAVELLRRAEPADRDALMLAGGGRWESFDEDGFDDEGSGNGILAPLHNKTRSRIEGELGVVQLARGDYIDALNRLLSANYWADAAYIAEQVLTIDELRRFVDAQPSYLLVDALPSLRKSFFRIQPAKALRALLARRLMREHQDAVARQYFVGTRTISSYDAYESAMQSAIDSSQAKLARSQSYCAAARILHDRGDVLIGTELEPDFEIFGGSFDHATIASARDRLTLAISPASKSVIAPTVDELSRMMKVRTPVHRWHYRYRAAELAWRGAKLLPDQSDELAEILRDGGNWLKARDPAAADLFYRALISRCDQTSVGKRALSLGWLPDTPVKR